MKNLYLGIDFGTTFTCISYYINNEAKVLINEDGFYTTPSAIFFDKDDETILFGKTATYQNNTLGTIVSNWKRIIGKTWNELTTSEIQFFKDKSVEIVNIDNIPHFKINYNKEIVYYNTLDLSILFFKYLYSLITKSLGKYNLNAVVTIPAGFSSNSRTELIKAFTTCNFNVLKVVNEPTAAALAYESDLYNYEDILVFDCGGGTTDISLIQSDYENKIFTIQDVIGDNLLGGEDLTTKLMNYLIDKFNIKHEAKSCKKLIREIENCKSFLSNNYNRDYTFYVECIKNNNEKVIDVKTNISNNLFYEINKSVFLRVKNLLEHFIQYKVQVVLFIGGSSRFYQFKTIMKQIFPNVILIDTLDVDRAVSIGACKYAWTLKVDEKSQNDEDDILLLDVVPIALGIEVEGGLFETIIPRCTTLPESRIKVFTNDSDTDKLEINVYQGESRFVKNNYYLNTIIIPLDKKYQRGESKVFVEFYIDTSGVLDITVKINEETIKTQLSREYLSNKLPENLDDIIHKYTVDKLLENNLANEILEEL